MELLWLIIGILIGIFMTISIRWLKTGRYQDKSRSLEKEKIDITLEDIIRLAALNTTLDVTSLIVEYKVNIKIPKFYEKYQVLSKQLKDAYYTELLGIFSKNKGEEVQNLFDQYRGLSVQDVLLLLMMEAQIDNKTIVRILAVSPDALKKRKARLKFKMRAGDAESDVSF